MSVRLPQLVVAVGLLSGSVGTAIAAPTTARVPAGFELLDDSREAIIDVRFLGKSLGQFSATITANAVQFHSPGKVEKAMPLGADVSAVERASLLAALSRPLPRNSEKACDTRAVSSTRCNFIDTDSAALIYNESDDSVELFVAKAWLTTSKASDDRHAVSQNTSRAFVQRQLLNVAGSDRQYSFSAAFSAAMGITDASYLGANYALLSNGYRSQQSTELRVDDLYYRHDFARRYYVQAGRMDERNLSSPLGGSFGFSMLPVGRMNGVRVGTTQAYVKSDAASRRTPITILLTRQARVDAYRGKQLLGSFYLDAGAQDIDTSWFPTGSYLVTLRVIEDGREVRAEETPFSRVDAGKGVPGDIEWFAQAGNGTSRASLQKQSASIVGGVKYALNADTSLSLGVASQQGHLFSEGRIDWQRDTAMGMLRATGAVFASSDGSRGDSEQLYWGKGMSLSIFRTNVSSPNCRSGNYMSCYRSLSANASANVLSWNLGVSYGASWSAHSYQEFWRRDWAERGDPLAPSQWQDNGGDTGRPGRWVARETRSNTLQLSASRSFRFGRVGFSPSATLYARTQHGRTSHGALLAVSINHSSPSSTPGGFSRYTSGGTSVQLDQGHSTVRYQGSHSVSRNAGAFRSGSVSVSGTQTDDLNVTLGSRFEGRWGQANVTAGDSYSRVSTSHRPSVSGQYSSAFALGRPGFFWGSDYGGSEPLAGVGVVVDEDAAIEGEISDHPVAQVNEHRLGYGSSMLVPVQGFQKRLIDVRDPDAGKTGGVASVRKGAGSHDWFMLPGHLGVQRVTSAMTYTYVGRLQVADGLGGEPASAVDGADAPQGFAITGLEGGTVLDAAVAPIGPSGSFVADFDYRPTALHVVKGHRLYECVLPSATKKAAVLRVGKISCTAISVDALPKKLMSEERVQRVLRIHRLGVSARRNLSGGG